MIDPQNISFRIAESQALERSKALTSVLQNEGLDSLRQQLEAVSSHEYLRCLGILGDNALQSALTLLRERLEDRDHAQFYSTQEIANHACSLLVTTYHDERSKSAVKEVLHLHAQECCKQCIRYLETNESADPFGELTQLLLPLSAEKDLGFLPPLAPLSKKWGEWVPEFTFDSWSVDKLRQTLPGIPKDGIPEIVKKYEDPSSPNALVGAVTLAHHDVIHILLGRGLLDQDEAFVLGFTMGTATCGDIQDDLEKMRNLLQKEYQEPFRIPVNKLKAFDLGVECARRSQCKDIFLLKLTEEPSLSKSVGQLRIDCGIDKNVLVQFYRQEREAIPCTLESSRLPVAV